MQIDQLIAFQNGELRGKLAEEIARQMQDPSSEVAGMIQDMLGVGMLRFDIGQCGKCGGFKTLGIEPVTDPAIIASIKRQASYENN